MIDLIQKNFIHVNVALSLKGLLVTCLYLHLSPTQKYGQTLNFKL